MYFSGFFSRFQDVVKSPFASKCSWKKRSSHQGKKEVACIVSKFLVSCLWGCGESVNHVKVNTQEVQGALSSRPKGDPDLQPIFPDLLLSHPWFVSSCLQRSPKTRKSLDCSFISRRRNPSRKARLSTPLFASASRIRTRGQKRRAETGEEDVKVYMDDDELFPVKEGEVRVNHLMATDQRGVYFHSHYKTLMAKVFSAKY